MIIPTGRAMTPRIPSNSTIAEGVSTGSQDQSLCCQYALPVFVQIQCTITGTISKKISIKVAVSILVGGMLLT